MDFRIIVTISTLLLMTAESDQTTLGTNITEHPVPSQTNSSTSNCSCRNAAPAATAGNNSKPSSSAPDIGLLTITWTSQCQGDVNLIHYHRPNFSSPVCYGSEKNFMNLLRNVCENQKGCKNTSNWNPGRNMPNGYYITENGARRKESTCVTLMVGCTVEVLQDVQGQLQAYKVVTALICCALLVLLLIRFIRPTIQALQKRLSERRQNRWIGPTQSHSVSYHRGKTAVKNNDGENRLSYPALERLAFSDSREPSSNRNSDYNF